MSEKNIKTITLTLKDVYELARKFRKVHQRPDLYLSHARLAHDFLARTIIENYPEELDFRFGYSPVLRKDTPDWYPTHEEFLKGKED